MMKTAIQASRSTALAGAAAALALAAMGFAGAVQARDNVQWSVGVGTPGAVVNVGNAGMVYPQPVYVAPQPVYVQPAPVYVQPRPVYVQPRPVFVQPGPVYLQPQPIYYGRPYRHHKHHWRHDGYYVQGANQGYGPVYYQREGRGDNRHDWRDGRDDSRHDGHR
jgi:hypothetical protein